LIVMESNRQRPDVLLSQRQTVNSKSELAGSYRAEPEVGRAIAEFDPSERIVITAHLQSPDGETQGDCREAPTTNLADGRSALAVKNRTEFSPAARIFEDFASRHSLRSLPDLEHGCIRLEGTSCQLSELFGTKLIIHDDGQRRFRARSGVLLVPSEIAPWIRSVLGFDERPVVNSLVDSILVGGGLGMWPTEIAQLYGVPATMDAPYQSVGILAVDAGYIPADVENASKAMKRSVPKIYSCYIDGFSSGFKNSEFDTELALDLEIIAGLVPSASIVIYFTPNTESGVTDAINYALMDGTHRPHVLSISYGGIERVQFSEAGCQTIDNLLKAAGSSRIGLTVVAAAGDQLATAGRTDNGAHVLFPSSSSYALACGGTQFAMSADGSSFSSETVWHDQINGTGGGISDIFPVPAYQASVKLPASRNPGRIGRGLPDIAAAASKSPGYKIYLNGQITLQAGTSAATPLWAALIAMANAKRGTPLGFINDFLYAHAALCRPINVGNNATDGIGYYAGDESWNACTGLGVPKGMDTINALAAKP
jgi:kumamolisin